MIIDFNRYNGGGGSGSGVTPEQVQQQIDSALTPYWDSAATEDAISAATSGKADAANVSGRSTGYYFPYYNEQGVITGDTQAYKASLTIHLSDGSTSSANLFKDNNYGIPGIYVASKPGTAGQIAKSDGHGFTWADDIYTPTSGFSTINGSAITNGGNIVIQGGGGDVSGYWNSAQTKSYVDNNVRGVQDQIDTMDEVVSAALVDLNERVDEISGNTGGGTDLSNYWNSAQTENAISVATQDMVTSTDIKHIVKCTQAEYDDPSFIRDPETLYIIVNSI